MCVYVCVCVCVCVDNTLKLKGIKVLFTVEGSHDKQNALKGLTGTFNRSIQYYTIKSAAPSLQVTPGGQYSVWGTPVFVSLVQYFAVLSPFQRVTLSNHASGGIPHSAKVLHFPGNSTKLLSIQTV